MKSPSECAKENEATTKRKVRLLKNLKLVSKYVPEEYEKLKWPQRWYLV